MSRYLDANVLSTAEARSELPALLAHCAEHGADAAPVAIGRRRRPEAVLVSMELWRALERYVPDALVDRLAAERVRDAAPLQRAEDEPPEAQALAERIARDEGWDTTGGAIGRFPAPATDEAYARLSELVHEMETRLRADLLAELRAGLAQR